MCTVYSGGAQHMEQEIFYHQSFDIVDVDAERKENESYMHGSLFIWKSFECVGFDLNTTSSFRLKAAPFQKCVEHVLRTVHIFFFFSKLKRKERVQNKNKKR